MSSEQGHSIFRHGFYMQNFSPSGTANLPSTCDEELVDEADEPPDAIATHFSRINYSLSDAEFSKHSIYEHPAPKESLLTRALLTSPVLGPVDRVDPPQFSRGMSVWSNTSAGSTVDLTSDCGMTSPSRANTPSPPPPMYLTGIARVMEKGLTFNEPKRIDIVGDKQDVIEGLGRKRCITFAAGVPPPSRRGSEDQVTRADEFKKEPIRPSPSKRNSALTFVCAQKEDSQQSTARPLRSPPPAPKHIDFAATARRESCATAQTKVVAPVASKPVTFAPKVAYPERQLYDSESAADSWTNLPIDKTRLLRVDDLLRKERDIRKLSEEAEAEALQEEGMVDEEEEEEEEEDTLVQEDVDEEEEEEDDEDDYQDEYDEDEDEDDDDYDGESGNESDNESGFASDDEDDDDFFALHPPMLIPTRPAYANSFADMAMSPRQIRPTSPELPDSTDFVCGTFDEDKPLEEAYLSCLEERKRIKHKATPQDIDPSFPTSDPEDSDHEPETRHIGKITRDDSFSDGNQSRGRKMRGGMTKDQSPNRGRVHSPAPVRRTALAQSPAPSRRVPSRTRHASPPPPVRRGSRILSPAPCRRRTIFQTGNSIVRARSLPRNRTSKSSRVDSAAGSPVRARPVFIGRGAIDIVKGLEKKRERRRARLNRKEKDESWRAGAGVEKMRELGLEICGKGRTRPIWVISA